MCSLWSSFTVSYCRLNHCQCLARAGSVGIVNFRLGQRRRRKYGWTVAAAARASTRPANPCVQAMLTG